MLELLLDGRALVERTVDARNAPPSPERDLTLAVLHALQQGHTEAAEAVARARAARPSDDAAIVVAFGSCATSGGINALKNHLTPEECRQRVYGADATSPLLDSLPAQPIAAVIPVDYQIRGCPISRDEFVQVVGQLLHGTRKLSLPTYPVCMECKRRETVCRYDDGGYCLGMVALAGCGAPCPADGIPCEACRGLVDEPNLPALAKVLQENGGLSAARARIQTRLFTANAGGA